MKSGVILGVLCLLAVVSAKWCCGDENTPISAKIQAVTRSRSVQKTAIEYHQLKTGYKPCPNNTIDEKDVPKGLGHGTDDTSENRRKYKGILGLIFGGSSGGNLGNGEYHSYCPIYTTKSRQVVKYLTEYYVSAQFDEKSASCPSDKRVCCKGFSKVGDTCVEEKDADKAAENLEALKALGIIG